MVIDGSGAPPIGPMDIVVEGNKIAEVRGVGFPKVDIDPERRPKDATREIDGAKMYVLPGFVDMHGHPGGTEQGTTAEYVFKLWLAHGITTVRVPGTGNGLAWTIHERDRGARNEIVAPRIIPYVFTGLHVGIGAALIGMVLGEMLVVLKGLGGLIVVFSNSYQPAKVIVPLFAIVAESLILVTIMRRLRKRLMPWS